MIGVPALSQLSSPPQNPCRQAEVVTWQRGRGPKKRQGRLAVPTPGLSISMGSLSNGGKSDPCLGTAWKTRGQRMPKNEARCQLPLEPGEGNGNVFLKTQRARDSLRHLKACLCPSLQVPARRVFVGPRIHTIYRLLIPDDTVVLQQSCLVHMDTVHPVSPPASSLYSPALATSLL